MFKIYKEFIKSTTTTKKTTQLKNGQMIWPNNISKRHTNCQQAHEKMFNITNYKENTNQNYSETSLSQRKEIRGVGKKYEKW